WQAGAPRLVGQQPEGWLDRGADPLAPTRPLAASLGNPSAQVVEDQVVGGQEALLLGGEVLVEGPTGDAGVGRDVGDRGVGEPAPADRFGQTGGQALALGVDGELPWQALTPTPKTGEPGRLLVTLAIAR